MEDEGQNIHLKNLSVHTTGCEEDALNLLFLGDTNRMIAEVMSIYGNNVHIWDSSINRALALRLKYPGL